MVKARNLKARRHPRYSHTTIKLCRCALWLCGAPTSINFQFILENYFHMASGLHTTYSFVSGTRETHIVQNGLLSYITIMHAHSIAYSIFSAFVSTLAFTISIQLRFGLPISPSAYALFQPLSLMVLFNPIHVAIQVQHIPNHSFLNTLFIATYYK